MIPCILSGGSGTRLWPVSRQSHPKQFCELLDESLILKTVRRLSTFSSPWVVTNAGMKVLTERLYRDLGLPTDQILYEPAAKNTAAAIALFCKVLALRGKASEVVGIFPADHLIENQDLFQRALKLASDRAREGHVVTLGISPTYPSTGYGYMELSGAGASAELKAERAVRFCEKPDLKTAEEYLRSGRFVWNAGIFVFRADRMSSLLEKLLPEVWGPVSELKADLSNLKDVYGRVKSISIDYGIMEKLEDLLCIPCKDLGWSDVGSWDEVAKIQPESKNVLQVEASGNFVHSTTEGKVYALAGVQDLIVVDTADALMVVPKGRSQSVKDLQEKLAKESRPVATQHVYEYRPWGYFEILRDTDLFKSKVIRVEPGQQLSYQSHAKRAEHWVVTRGRPEVVLNDETLHLEPGQHVYIPLGAKHRMRNPTKEIVEFVEVQVGTYFGEDDIVRYEDDYKRT